LSHPEQQRYSKLGFRLLAPLPWLDAVAWSIGDTLGEN